MPGALDHPGPRNPITAGPLDAPHMIERPGKVIAALYQEDAPGGGLLNRASHQRRDNGPFGIPRKRTGAARASGVYLAVGQAHMSWVQAVMRENE